MSQAPYALRNARWGSSLGKDLKLEDTLWSGLQDSYVKLPMAITAEKLAEIYGITREMCDEFALTSQQRWTNGGHYMEWCILQSQFMMWANYVVL